MTNTDGAATWFRGMLDAVTENSELVLTFSLKAAETIYKGQSVSLDQDNNQATSPTAGTDSDGDTNGYIHTMSSDDVVLIGVSLDNVDDSDTTANEYGERSIAVCLRGIVLMRCIVNATGTGDGYEKPIKVGSIAMAAGDSCTVSGFTGLTAGAYVAAAGGTDTGSAQQVGWFLDSQDGHSTSQTISNDSTTIAASQSEDPSTWVRVYIDTFALHSGTITTLSI